MKKQLKRLTVITHPNPKLRLISKPINLTKIDKKTIELTQRMIITMELDKGVGLAASQIGKSIRLIVISYRDSALTLINPKITKVSKKTEISEEGCLSLPKIFGNVKRSLSVECQYSDLLGNQYIMKATGLLARVIQHEIDHLDGILFIDKATQIIDNNQES